MSFLKLFKKSERGFQEWAIAVKGNVITVRHGMVGGAIQEISEVISAGKNEGKANATTAEVQAFKEATSKYEKQLKKGYVESLTSAEAGEVASVIEGGVLPMLAHKFSEQGHKIKWPCCIQPKLDGIRCIAILGAGKCTLWSRTRKRINSVPHIEKALLAHFGNKDIILDGELYCHQYRDKFEEIVSIVRKEEPATGHEVVEYHVYDVVNDKLSFIDRGNLIPNLGPESPIKTVYTKEVLESSFMEEFDSFVAQGYEGAMLRNKESKYVNKRSYDLQKVKEFQDEEFEISGVEESKGKRAGQAVLILKTAAGKEFRAVPKGTDAFREKLYREGSSLEGKKATICFQNFTTDGIPRFPVCKAIRDYE